MLPGPYDDPVSDPSLTSFASPLCRRSLPRLPVPAVAVSSGTTFDDAEITVNAAMVFRLDFLARPVDAVGSVTVIDADPLEDLR